MKKILIISFFLCTLSGMVWAQDTLTRKEWRKQQKSYLVPGRPWSIEVPLWVPGFAGSFAYGNVELDGEDGEDPGDPGDPGKPPPGGGLGDIISRLFSSDYYVRYFYMGKISFEKKRFLVEFDAFGGEVGGAIKFNLNNKDIVKASFRMINTRLIAGYKIVNVDGKRKKFRYGLVAFIGARASYSRLYSELIGVSNKLEINPATYMPLVGLQNQFIWRRWKIIVQGDFGAMPNPDRYSIHISNFVFYRTGRLISLKFGWNHLLLNTRGTFLKEDYNIKVTLSGPATGLVFHF